MDDFKGRRSQSERDFIKALEAWLAPTRFSPRTIGKVVSATALIEYAFSEGDALLEGKAVGADQGRVAGPQA